MDYWLSKVLRADWDGVALWLQVALVSILLLAFLYMELWPHKGSILSLKPLASIEQGENLVIQTAKELSKNQKQRYAELKEIAENVWVINPILAKLAVAQAILESGLNQGISGLASSTNNIFGIKGTGDAGTSHMDTAEYVNGRRIVVKDGFARYSSLIQAFRAHKAVLMHPRYEDVRRANTLEEAARAVQECGYATDPKYAVKLLSVMKQLERV